jgi:anti-anti-sigma regulatory factor
MATLRTFANERLRVTVEEGSDALIVRFLGKSTLRNPKEFVLPILQQIYSEAKGAAKRVVMDFRDLAYMSSSTLTPVIKVLEQARMGEGRVTVSYRKSLRWQDVAFSALQIFETNDRRIDITGTE